MTNSNSKNYFKCVRDYLMKHSLADLRRQHGVRYNIRGHLVTLAYDQFEANNSNRIACNCRGAVIAKPDGGTVDDTSVFGELELLAFPFTRFFNYGQQGRSYTFNPVAIYEKFDGTCIIFYWDKFADMWQVATRNIPDGSNIANSFASNGTALESVRTFRDLFEKAVVESATASVSNLEDFGSYLDKRKTYVFELMTPENQVVVHHGDYKVALIGIRDLDSEKEVSVEDLSVSSVPVLKPNNEISQFMAAEADKITFHDIAGAVNEFAENRDPTKHEGFVVVGHNFERIKIKSSGYVKHNRVHDLSFLEIVESIMKGDIDDLIPLAPGHIKAKIALVEDKFQTWVRVMNNELADFWWQGFEQNQRKEFAEYVKSKKTLAPLHSYIFRAFGEGRTIREVQEVLKGNAVAPKKVWEWIQ